MSRGFFPFFKTLKAFIFDQSFSPYVWIVFTGFLLYFKTLFFDLTYFDDNVWILDYQWYLNNVANIPQFFSQPDLVSDVFYRPLLSVSFMLNALIGGTAPLVYHATNVGIHLLNGCLVFALLRKMAYEKSWAWAFALIFTVHPVLTQAVVWIPGRTDSLLGTLVLAAFIFYLRFLDGRRVSDFIGHLAFFILALLTKETAVVLPLMCFLYYWLIQRKEAKNKNAVPGDLGLSCFGWGGIGLLWFALRQAILASGRQVSGEEALRSMWENASSLISYTGKIFLPVNLSVLPISKDTRLVFGMAAILLISLALVFSKKRRWPRILFGFGWFLFFLLPSLVISFLNHEYRLYLPILGMMIILLEILRNPDPAKNKEMSFYNKLGIFCVIGVFFGMTFQYSDNFKNRLMFWENAVKTSPHSPLAHRNLGAMCYLEGQWEKAEREFKKALEINPLEFMAHNNLGLIYMNKKQFAVAEEEYKKEILINPAYDNVYFNYGLLCYQLGRFKEMENLWKKTLALNPKYLAAYKNLAVFYMQQNDFHNAGYYMGQLEKMGVPIPAEMREALKAGMRP